MKYFFSFLLVLLLEKSLAQNQVVTNGAGIFTGTTGWNGSSANGVFITDQNIYSLTGGGSARNLSLWGQNLIFGSGISYSEKMRLTELGRLGIGTNSPGSLLSLMLPNGQNGVIMSMARSNGAYYFHTSITEDSRYSILNNGYSELFTIKHDGNVGIGTTNPMHKLEVNGIGAFTGSINVGNTTMGTLIGNGRIVSLNGTSGNPLSLEGKIINFSSGVTYASKMLLDENGNLTIGVNNSGAYKLAVDGTIGARKLKITQSSWADEVFKPSYKLKPLLEVEQFIVQNQHLPGVPSEKQVIGKDLDISDTQTLLLRKIEELTLYVIELKKENESQNKTLKNMYDEISKLKVKSK